ncbi:unnamed protein product [Protopolystoma xenopodis]|uniref:Uncharacterized protein n=1 Tax=Protopolystoma xenopodis TaxID=117903 RepID=A0A448WX19_9PLAT|nr:unnamed protein product [Protopolystoma xenopodis]
MFDPVGWPMVVAAGKVLAGCDCGKKNPTGGTCPRVEEGAVTIAEKGPVPGKSELPVFTRLMEVEGEDGFTARLATVEWDESGDVIVVGKKDELLGD